MMRKALSYGATLLAACTGIAMAAGTEPRIDPPAEGSVSAADGLAAFQRIYEVVSSPRCSNCHVGPDNLPMWSGPSYGQTRRHGMNIHAGESRIGSETIPCSTCHTTLGKDDPGANATPHAAPRVTMPWQLAPVDFEWFGKTPAEICAQLSDSERNGGRDFMALAEHLVTDGGHGGFVQWGWTPGGGRQPAPYTLQDHINDVLAWGVAGQPCP